MAHSTPLVSQLNTNRVPANAGGLAASVFPAAPTELSPGSAGDLATGVFRCKRLTLPIKTLLALALLTPLAHAQLPDGPGKSETERICSQCHELARSISLRQDRAGWEATVNQMVSLGAKATDKETAAVIDYLASHYAADEVPRINVNKARAIDLESGLTLKRSEAAAIIEYRTRNGPFKSIEDLKKVPGIDAAKIESKKDRLTFQDKP
jgi:competence protein ComEA